MKRFGKCLVAAILSIAMVFGLVPMMSEKTEAAASKNFLAYSDFPVNAMGNGTGFVANVTVDQWKTNSLQGWMAAYGRVITKYWYSYNYAGRTYTGTLNKVNRPDVQGAFPGYTSYTGFQLGANSKPDFSNIYEGQTVVLKIYAAGSAPQGYTGGYAEYLIGTYNITKTSVTQYASREYENWKKLGANDRNNKINEYFNVGCGTGNYGKWCAAFVSYCINKAGKLSWFPAVTSDDKMNCAAMRNTFIGKGRYISTFKESNDKTNADIISSRIKPGDVVFFIGSPIESKTKDNFNEKYVSHHVGIVISVARFENSIKISYIHGNSNNGNISLSEQMIDTNSVSSGTILGFGLLHN